MASAESEKSTPGQVPEDARPRRRSVTAYLVWTLLIAAALVVLYTLLMLWWSYSEGERAGVLQKFSKRGWICKTYEGELAMYVVGGVAPQIWDFSVRDEVTAAALTKAVGRQVRLHYTEHPGLPTSCFGETDYFVDGVEIVGPPRLFGSGGTGAERRPRHPPSSHQADDRARAPGQAGARGRSGLLDFGLLDLDPDRVA